MPDFVNPEPCNDEPSFEAGLAELQELVRVLEEGALGLDDSIARFERGISLLRRCYQALERAEQKIELLTGFDRAGNPVTTPFDGTATLDAANAAPSKRQSGAGRKRAEPKGPPEVSLPEEREKGLPLF
jgi:exodeoxyribonuclease VII small subunit